MAQIPLATASSRLDIPDIAEQKITWNNGVFNISLSKQDIVPIPLAGGPLPPLGSRTTPRDAATPIEIGTMDGTAKAATAVYSRILKRYSSYYDMSNFEAVIPQQLSTNARRELFTWSDGTDGFPPHLAVIPKQDQNALTSIPLAIYSLIDPVIGWVIPEKIMQLVRKLLGPVQTQEQLTSIFNSMRLLDTGVILSEVFPQEFVDFIGHDPNTGATIQDIVDHNVKLVTQAVGIYTVSNVGVRPEWYSDAVFAQQHLTGPNPATITLASAAWIEDFVQAAKDQKNTTMAKYIESADSKSLYIQDYSDFRSAAGVAPDVVLTAGGKTVNDPARYGCAAVCLFHVDYDRESKGKFHPLAIVIDYRGSMKNSVVIFNKRLQTSDTTVDQAKDWPWRYAKTCVLSSDWVRHEVSVHLVRTHLMEESVIVAAQRSFEPGHPVYTILKPHWLKTLSLNEAARTTLVPQVVAKLAGIPGPQLMAFLRNAHATFNWAENYVPENLRRRGFPPEQLATDPKFVNYPYGRNMILMWNELKRFVQEVLELTYRTDDQVRNDKEIASWVSEMQGPAQVKGFPNIQTREQLIDAITMCIHLASPQHTAVNYLQEYYQTFVPNKTPSLYSPLPTTIDALNAYTEGDLMNALPVKKDLARQWLLASHLPHLLNMTVAADQNLVNYAVTLYQLMDQPKEAGIKRAAENFYRRLYWLDNKFQAHNLEQSTDSEPYNVMDPDAMAVSILI